MGALLEERATPKQRHDVVVKGGLDLCRLWGGGAGPSPACICFLLTWEPQALAMASHFFPNPGLPHLTQLPRVHGGTDRAAEVPQEVTGVGESAQHAEAGRAVGVGHQPLVRALWCADRAPHLRARTDTGTYGV